MHLAETMLAQGLLWWQVWAEERRLQAEEQAQHLELLLAAQAEVLTCCTDSAT